MLRNNRQGEYPALPSDADADSARLLLYGYLTAAPDGFFSLFQRRSF